jgi:methylated-DNA-[protein]-cysteine S-methyltransferase
MIKVLQSPLGELAVTVSDEMLVSIGFDTNQLDNEKHMMVAADLVVMNEVEKQLNEYFRGERIIFNLPLSKQGTIFQQSVWQQLLEIPYGETICYQELAERIGQPSACRAVGQANRRNPLPIVVPCHRVVGKDHSLKGYAGSLTQLKEILLLHEAKQVGKAF